MTLAPLLLFGLLTLARSEHEPISINGAGEERGNREASRIDQHVMRELRRRALELPRNGRLLKVKHGAAVYRRLPQPAICKFRKENNCMNAPLSGVMRLARVFDPARIDAARRQIWSVRPNDRIDHRLTGSETPHIFHSFIVDEFGGEVRSIFDELETLSGNMTGVRPKFIRQAIQYPRGGGFFGEHEHDLEPQKIGLILMASEYGRDYQSGSVRFKVAGEWQEVPMIMGDVCAFRHDLPHEITPVDPDVPLDWNSPAGRWTFILSVPGAT